MNSAILSGIAAMSGALAMIAVYFASKKHKEQIEDQAAESNHVTAISSASETLAAAVNVLIQPLTDSIVRLQDRERETAIEITKIRAELALVKADHRRLNHDLTSLIRYVRVLWWQIKQVGAVPVAPPDELEHLDWDAEPEDHTEV